MKKKNKKTQGYSYIIVHKKGNQRTIQKSTIYSATWITSSPVTCHEVYLDEIPPYDEPKLIIYTESPDEEQKSKCTVERLDPLPEASHENVILPVNTVDTDSRQMHLVKSYTRGSGIRTNSTTGYQSTEHKCNGVYQCNQGICASCGKYIQKFINVKIFFKL